MSLQDSISEAIEEEGPLADPTDQADAALDALAEFVAADTGIAHAVALSVSLRQAANETPIAFVRRIVSAYLAEAKAAGGGWADLQGAADAVFGVPA